MTFTRPPTGDQRATAVDGGVHQADHARDLKHLHDRQHHVLLAAIAQNALAAVAHEAGVRVHAAQGQAGGASGVRVPLLLSPPQKPPIRRA